MTCSQCKSQNPIGNKFCRECGGPLSQPTGPLAQDDISRADAERLSERVAGLLSAAFTLSEQKRFDQALPIAEEAVMLLPQSTSALSLLATLLEQTGQTARAVTVMERVVANNPESPADREKLDFLRKKPQLPAGSPSTKIVHTPASAVVPQADHGARGPHWAPFVLGGAAAACVLGIWLSFVNSGRSLRPAGTAAGLPNAAATAAAPVSPAGETPGGSRSAAEIAAAMASAAQPPSTPRGGNGIPPAADLTRADPFTALGSSPVNAAPTVRERSASGTTLPPLRIPAGRPGRSTAVFPLSTGSGSGAADAGGGDATGTLPPIIAVPPPATGAFGATRSSTSLNGGSAVAPSGGDAVAPATFSANNGGAMPAPTPTPYIKITIGGSASGAPASSATSRVSGGVSTGEGGGADSLSRARHLQSNGHYSEAISAYQQSLSDGSSNSGAVQQGIAQSYARLGNEPAARGAYRDAIQAFQAQAASGRNTAAAERGIAACKAALEVLGGN